MRRITLALALSALATASILPSTAAASGPAAPGKETVEINCTGLGTITVSVPRPEKSNGAGQIVGEKGHGIPTATSFTLTDVTTNTVIFNETHVVGRGHAHSHQTVTQCESMFFEGPASTFFEGHEPPGVEPSDIVRASFEADVIVKR
jgi:hypothetical protein